MTFWDFANTHADAMVGALVVVCGAIVFSIISWRA